MDISLNKELIMLDKIKTRIKKIDAEKYYSPAEINAMGVILNTAMQPSRPTLYRLIRNKTIKVVKVGSGTTKPHYKIKGAEIINFINNR